jgi:hypothetical protein
LSVTTVLRFGSARLVPRFQWRVLVVYICLFSPDPLQ